MNHQDIWMSPHLFDILLVGLVNVTTVYATGFQSRPSSPHRTITSVKFSRLLDLREFFNFIQGPRRPATSDGTHLSRRQKCPHTHLSMPG